jgi:hypothetical protein
MYYVIDITAEPPVRVPGAEFETYEECVNWLELNGDIINYSIESD